MKKMILVFAIVLSVFGCSKPEEVKPVVVVPPVVKPIRYFLADRTKYYASDDNGMIVMAKSKQDYNNGIFIIPPSYNLKIRGLIYVLGDTRAITAYYNYDNEAEIIINIQDKNSLGTWFVTYKDLYFLIK